MIYKNHNRKEVFMAIIKYDKKTESCWEKAEHCNCNSKDCHPNSHRLCGICGDVMFYGAHQSVKSQINSRGCWNIDHIIPSSKGGSNNINNLCAVHVRCNREKGNRW